MTISEEQEDWDDWEEDFNTDAVCLFCPEKCENLKSCLEHLLKEHDFDLVKKKKCKFLLTRALEFYDYIKMINYLRSLTLENKKLTTLEPNDYANEEYLQSVLPDDALIMGILKLRVAYDELDANEGKIDQLEQELKETKEALETLKQMTRDYFMTQSNTEISDFNVAVPQDSVSPNGYYFESYASNEIHEQMLKDSVRTEAYRDYIYGNKHLFKDKTVLDVGCGTGILSMFASRAGAKRVIAVDNSAIIEKAKKNAAENQISNIEFIKKRVEDLDLDEKVDVIISEWMGYFLLFEGMLDSVLVARDLYLKPNGIMCPGKCDILIAAIQDDEYLNEKFHYWNNVYGFKMSAMKDGFFGEAKVEVVEKEAIVSSVQTIKKIDIGIATSESLDFTSDFELEINKDCTVHGICGWFDSFFNGDESIVLPTSPLKTPTHWKQTMFLFNEPIKCVQGHKLQGSFKCSKSSSNFRELDIEITVNEKTSRYQLK